MQNVHLLTGARIFSSPSGERTVGPPEHEQDRMVWCERLLKRRIPRAVGSHGVYLALGEAGFRVLHYVPYVTTDVYRIQRPFL